MTTITPIYVQAQPQQTQSKHKVQAQVGNAVTGALELGAVYGGVRGGATLGRKIVPLDNAFTTFAKKVAGKVETFADKVAKRALKKAGMKASAEALASGYSKGLPKYGLPRYAQVLQNIANEFKGDARNSVGKYMLAPVMILTLAGIVGKTIFNAGKISSEQ